MDLTGLKPLDTAGLREADAPEFDLSGLKPLDVSGLKPVEKDRPNFASNIVRGAGERSMDLGGGLLRSTGGAAESAGDFLERRVPLGAIEFGPDGISYKRRLSEEEIARPQISTFTNRAAKTLEDASLGYEPRTTWEQVKQSPLSTFIPFAIEQGLVSAPDMAAAIGALPAYIASRTGEVAQNRAENDKRDDATVNDLLIALPPAVAMSMMERIGAKGMFGLDEVAVRSLRQLPGAVVKAGTKEALTEAAQEGIEYTTTTVGTEKGYDPAQMADQMAAGAVGGGVFGGMVRTGTGAYEIAQGQPQAQQAGIPEGASPGEDMIGADPDAEPQIDMSAFEADIQPDPQIDMAAFEADITQPDTGPQPEGILAGNVARIIDETATRYGIDPAAMRRLAWIESRGNPNAQNPNSSAGGLFQFIDGTAQQYGLGNKFDPVASADAAARLWLDNRASLTQALGREPTPGELYLAHQQGAGGASALLSRPDELAMNIVGLNAVVNNGGNARMTAREFADLWISKFEGRGAAVDGPDRDFGPAPVGAPSQAGADQQMQPLEPGASDTAPMLQDLLDDPRPIEEIQAANAPEPVATQTQPITVSTGNDLAQASAQVNTSPTDGQKEAGNYRKGHIRFAGLDGTIETPMGATRTGTDPDGNAWSVVMPADYGYFKRTKGADGDQVDAYFGPNPQATSVWIVDQIDPFSWKFDEHKVLAGFSSEQEAESVYVAAFSDGRGQQRIGALTEMPLNQFRQWLRSGDTKKPLAYRAPRPVSRTPRDPSKPLARPAAAELMSRGGIAPNSPIGRLLISRNITPKRFPGLFRKNGMRAIDNIPRGEVGIFGGYRGISGPDTGNEQLYVAPDEWIEALEAEAAGNPYRTQDQIAYLEEQAAKEYEKELDRRRIEVIDTAARNGAKLTDTEVSRIVDLIDPENPNGMDLSDAIVQVMDENAVAYADKYLSEAKEPYDGGEWIQTRSPFDEGEGEGVSQVVDEPAISGEGSQGLSQDGGEPGSGGENAQGPVAGNEAEGLTATSEAGADGQQQLVIPGAEQISGAQQAQMGAAKPLTPKKPQKPADEGLFGDSATQTDLVDMAKRPEPKPAAKPKETYLGLNSKGFPLFEDENGVRFYVEPPGIRISEPVEIIPGGGMSVDSNARRKEFLTEDERGGATSAPNITKQIENAKRRLFEARRKGDAEKVLQIEQEIRKLRQRAFEDEDQAEAEAAETSPATAPDPTPEKNPELKPAPNTIFTEEAAAAALAFLKSRLSGQQLNSGIDPAILQAGITLAGYHIEKGARSFPAYAKAMIEVLGDAVRPYLKSWYMGVKYDPRAAGFEGMSTAAEVEAFNLDTTDADVQPTDDIVQERDEGAEPAEVPADGETGATGADAGQSGEGVRGGRGGGEASGAERPGDAGTGRDEAGADAQQPVRGGGKGSPEPGIRENYRIAAGELKRDRSWRGVAERNVEIVETVKRIMAEGRKATAEEKALLVKYTGWGASEVANGVFPNQYGSWKGREWQELGERLKAALTPEEYAQARRTTQYAHYTSEPVIRSVYSALERMGFAGGKVLEPGMGTGHFVGLMPDAVAANSTYTGVEYDTITGNIAKLLYPDSNIVVGDFADTKLPKNFFDVAVGNPPFGQIQITSDPEYRKNAFLLHDYFFAKTIDRVKPGGLLVFVTSKGTMDKANDRARQYLSERADLVGAIRLPQTAFKDNAGTEVVTDVIFLKKREKGAEPAGESWLGLKPVKTPQGEAQINEYFVDHPEMVLGRHSMTGSMYRANEYTVEPIEGDIEELFAKAVENLPEGIYRAERGSKGERAAVDRRDYDPKVKKEGGVYVADDGVLMQVSDGSGVPLVFRVGSSNKEIDLKPREIEWLKGYVKVRDALKQAQYDQLNEGDWEASLKALNKAYDTFTKKHGKILAHSVTERENEDGTVTVTRRFKNDTLIRLDAEGALAFALESISADGTISKGAALLGRVLQKPATPRIVTTNDAMFVSLNEIGEFDLADIAKRAGKSEKEVIEDLGAKIYEDPESGWTTASDYLSGNVVAKLKQARAAARTDKRYKRNVEALEAVQPAPLAPADITANLGAAWVPPSDVANFASQIMGVRVEVRYSPIVGRWSANQLSGSAPEFSVDDMGAGDVLEAVLNNRQLKITKRDRDGKTYTDDVATEKLNDIARKLKAEFRSWIWSDADRADRLTKFYNENFNNIAPRKFDGSHLTLPGVSSRFELRPHQKRAIWRTIQEGDTYYAHAVGAGKTFTMIAAGMEERRLGLAKKPMYVVPNHMLAQFSKEFLELYPTASIMVADEQNFHTHNRRKFVAQAALNDPDAIVITHSAFGRIGMSQKYQQKFINDQIADWESLLDEVDKSDRLTVKQIERRIEQLENRLEKLIKTPKDQLLDFEELGVDRLYVDEGHEFRKLDFPTLRGAIKGIDPSGSQRAMDLMMKLSWLRSKNPKRSLVMASGTPVTNTMGELFTVQRYFQIDQLKEDGTEYFDTWSVQYGDVVEGLEQNAAGGYEVVARFSRFLNVPELMARVRSFMDILTSEQLGDLVPRPSVVGGGREIVVTPPPDGYKEYQKSLESRIKAIRARKGPPAKGDDIILKVIGDGRFSAIDMRFVNPTQESDPKSKLNRMLDDVLAAYKESEGYEYQTNGEIDPLKGASLMIFTDLGLGEQSAETRGFDMKGWIEKRLVDGGVKREHIAFIRDYKAHAKKERLFDDMRQGRKRILIGGKDMETGVNAQKRLKYLFHLDAPWFPASVEQREGRIIRQGNQNREVVVRAYATKGSYDSTMWGMNARKARFIEQAMSGDASVRSMEDVSEASSFEMAAALASGDERYLKLAGLKADVDRLGRLYASHVGQQKTARSQRLDLLAQADFMKRRAKELKEAVAKRQAIEAGAFKATIGKTTYEKRDEFNEALFEDFRKRAESGKKGETVVGAIAGFDLVYHGQELVGQGLVAELSVDVPSEPDPLLVFPFDLDLKIGGLATRALNSINSLEADAAKAAERAEDARDRVEKLDKLLAKPFPEMTEYREKQEELAELEAELNAESKAQAAADAAQAQAAAEGNLPMASLAGRGGDTEMRGRIRREVDGPVTTLFREVEKADKKARDLGRRMRAEMDRLGLKHVALRLSQDIYMVVNGESYLADGRYFRNVIDIAMSAPNAMSTLHHEGLHALRRMGVFTDAEWTILSRRSLADWMKRYNIADAYAGFPQSAQIEEGIAHAYQAWAAGKMKPGGLIERAFRKIRAFFEALGNALRGMGFKSSESVFEDVFAGRIGARGQDAFFKAPLPTAEQMASMTIRRPVFYSAALRAATQVKQAKAQPAQWYAMISKAPGVKPEELEWLGLKEWLDGQSGALTREQVTDFIRANQIEVRDVQLGGPREFDEVVPSETAAAPYRERWDRLSEEIRQVQSDIRRAYNPNTYAEELELERLQSREQELEAERTELHNRMVQDTIEEMGGLQKPVRYGEYTLPGGENYRELLLTLPDRGSVSMPARIADLSRPQLMDLILFADRNADVEDLSLRELRELADAIELTDANLAEFRDRGFKPRGSDQAYRSAHWDTPNVLAHVRYSEREVPAKAKASIDDIEKRIVSALNISSTASIGSGAPIGALRKGAITEAEAAAYSAAKGFRNMPFKTTVKTLHIEEIQSDWHQAGRKKGYRKSSAKIDTSGWEVRPIPRETGPFAQVPFVLGPDGTPLDDPQGVGVYDQNGRLVETHYGDYLDDEQLIDQVAARMDRQSANDGVPDAPFKTTWPELAFKRMLRHAVDNGFDRIVWTPGDVQADRYDLSKQIERIVVEPAMSFSTPLGWYHITASDFRGRNVVTDRKVRNADEAADLVGKEMAERIFTGENAEKLKRGESVKLIGLDLKIGGEGMRGFYDQILPKTVEKMVKKWGGKVSTSEIDVKGKKAEVWSVDITDQMREAASQGLPLFSLRNEPKTALQRQTAMQGFLARGQFIDRAIRMPFDWAGGMTAQGEWKPGMKVADAVGRVIREAKPAADGRFGFLHGPLETVRRGLIDRYGLPADYVAADRKRGLQERAIMMEGAEVLKSLADAGVGTQEAKVLQAILTGEPVTDGQMARLAAPIRKAIDDLGAEAVSHGLVSAESYERNRGAYLHRVYAKHEQDERGLARMVSSIMGSRRKKIIGDQLKGRGLFVEVDTDRLMKDVPGFKEAGRGAPVLGEKFRVLDLIETQKANQLGEEKEVAIKRVYWPADEAIPVAYANYRDQGTWEVRAKAGKNKWTLWRDYTKAEREKMGEILDARYTIGKTYMLMAHDLATGRFYKDISENEAWSVGTPPSGKWVEATDWRRYAPDPSVEWVRVPTSEIAKSGGKKRFGALAGRWVRAEIWQDINELEIMQQPGIWRQLLTQWKLNKTARSPVVHTNNIISNLLFMDLADVRAQDLVAGIRSYVSRDQNYQEAMKAGAFGADMVSQEIRDDVLRPLLEEITQQQTGAKNPFLGKAWLVGRLADRLWTWAKAADKFALDAYRAEDEIFRMAMYLRQREFGATVEDAANAAREQFLDYDIRAPWVNAARNSVLPFISYTYRAVPLIARAVATRPWKIAKYATIAYMANALAYAWDDEGDEEKERAALRSQEQGYTWFGSERMLRMPWRDDDGMPVFLDVRRWIPAGDVFDTSQGSSAVPIPAPLQFGGPLLIGFEVALNKQGFTGQEISDREIDTWWEQTKATSDYLYKAFMPSAPWIPGSWYYTKIKNAATGALETPDRPYDMSDALLSSVGIKIRPIDVEAGIGWNMRGLDEKRQRLTARARSYQRQLSLNRISKSAYDKQIATINEKLARLSAEAARLGELAAR